MTRILARAALALSFYSLLGLAAAAPTLAIAAAAGAAAEDAKKGAAGEASPDLQARIDAARERLDAAARELAELSAQSVGPMLDQVFVFPQGQGQVQPPRRAILGIQVDPEPSKDGARVREVSPGGPAADAGIKAGDVIVSIGGTELRGRDDPAAALIERMREVAPDQPLQLKVLQDGRTRELRVTPRANPAARSRAFVMPYGPAVPAAPAAPGAPAVPAAPLPPFVGEVLAGVAGSEPFARWLGGGVGGMELATLTPKLGRYFGTEKGVLVVRAPEAAAWKLEDGDVIVSIDGRAPTNGAHATRILRSYQSGETLKIAIVRERKSQTLDVTVPDPPRRAESDQRRRVRVLRAPGTAGT